MESSVMYVLRTERMSRDLFASRVGPSGGGADLCSLMSSVLMRRKVA